MKKTKSLIISAMIMVFALAFTACGSKSSSVEGSWSGNDNGYDVVFNFEADGQGTMQLSGIQLNITYSVDGDKITINKSVLGGTQTDEYTFKISNKSKTLTLSNDSGEIELKKGEYHDYNIYLNATRYTVQPGHSLAIVIATEDPVNCLIHKTYSVAIDNASVKAEVPVTKAAEDRTLTLK